MFSLNTCDEVETKVAKKLIIFLSLIVSKRINCGLNSSSQKEKNLPLLCNMTTRTNNFVEERKWIENFRFLVIVEFALHGYVYVFYT